MQDSLKPALGRMANCAHWFVWRLEWSAERGKFLKTPCAHDGSVYRIDASKPEAWSDYETVAKVVRSLPVADGLRYALGFWLTPAAGVWLLDIDKCVDVAGQLLPFAAQMVAAFPGAMVEWSSSRKGVHIIGSCSTALPAHRNKPTREASAMLQPLELEFYTSGRGIAFGLEGVAGGCSDVAFDMTQLCANYFPPRIDVDVDGVRQEWRGPADDEALIVKMLGARQSAAAAFGGKVSINQLWTGDCERNSHNDAALASHLAFWTGCDEVRIERLMLRSGMRREKWSEHRTYLAMTIANACAACTNVYVEPLRPLPQLAPVVEPRSVIRNAADLLLQEFKPVQWAIREILPEGVTILSGDPKIGKSWLVYQASVAIATGSAMWHGRAPEVQGDALMLALEDTDRRLRRRLDILLAGFPGKRPDRLHYATQWPRAEAGVAAIAEWLREHPDCRLVVIDTISAFRDPDPGRLSAYANDYAVGQMLLPLAREFSCAIVIVMHNRKQAAGDVMHKVSGTQGMTGSVDNVLILERARGDMDAVLHVDGRDIEEQREMALRLSGGIWSYVGEAEDVQRSKERCAVREAMVTLGGYGKAKEIHEAMGGAGTLSATRMRLSRMHKAGEIENSAGVYTLVTPVTLAGLPVVTPANVPATFGA